MINSFYTPLIDKTLSLCIKKPKPDSDADDRVHYFVPKNKHHTLNFKDIENDPYAFGGAKKPIQLIDGEGVIRIETKNSPGVRFTVMDQAYVYNRVPAVRPAIGERGGWVPIPITDINFEEYEHLTDSKKNRGMKNILREGLFSAVLAPHRSLEMLMFNFTKPLTDEEIKAKEEKEAKNAFRLERIGYPPTSICIVHDGEGYRVDVAGNLNSKTNLEKIKSREWRVVAILDLSSYSPTGMNDFDDLVYSTAYLRIHAINHDDLKAIFGNELKFIAVDQFDQLDKSHFADYVKTEPGKRRGDPLLSPLVIHDKDGHYILCRPSLSDIENLDHTLTLLRKAVNHDKRSKDLW